MSGKDFTFVNRHMRGYMRGRLYKDLIICVFSHLQNLKKFKCEQIESCIAFVYLKSKCKLLSKLGRMVPRRTAELGIKIRNKEQSLGDRMFCEEHNQKERCKGAPTCEHVDCLRNGLFISF